MNWVKKGVVKRVSAFAFCCPGYSHRHAAFPVRLTRLFAHVLCNSPYGLKQTQNMSWQCAPHDGSLATVCGNSRGSSVVRTGNHKIKMPLILLSDIFYLNFLLFSANCLGKSPLTVFESVYPSELPPMMKSFFLCNGNETPGSVEPSGEHASCFGEVHRNAQHKETWNHWRELAEHTLFLIRPYFTPFCATYFRYALIKISILPSSTLSAFPVSSFVR